MSSKAGLSQGRLTCCPSRTVQVRSLLSVALAVLGALVLPFAVAAFYGREQVVDPDAFAGRALTALDEPAVRAALERETLVAIEDRFGARAVAGVEDVLRPGIEAVVASDEFRRLFEEAVLETRLFFLVREGSVATLDLDAAVPILREELRAADPRLARRLPEQLDLQLELVRRDDTAADPLLSNAEVRRLGVLLPLLAMAAFAGSIAVAPRRERALIVVGMATTVAAACLGVGLALSRELAVDRVEAGALFDVYFNDLYTWALVLAVAGLVVIAVGSWLARRSARRARSSG